MYKVERKQDIVALLQQQGFSSTQALAAQLRVSQTTIYRYLSELEEAGVIRKEYGGVTLADLASDGFYVDYRSRRQEHPAEKHAIADRAIELVEDGDTLFMDASTTCVAFAQRLTRTNLRDIAVVTNSARIVLAMRHKPEYRTICTGGTYLERHDTLIGSPAEEFIASLTAHKCFFSALGVTPQVCTDTDQAEVRIKKLMLSRSKHKILLADHSKFDRTTTFTVITPAELDAVVTDAGTTVEALAPFRALNLKILQA
jgi:DeoR family fructose operon transcriptional repressor